MVVCPVCLDTILEVGTHHRPSDVLRLDCLGRLMMKVDMMRVTEYITEGELGDWRIEKFTVNNAGVTSQIGGSHLLGSTDPC